MPRTPKEIVEFVEMHIYGRLANKVGDKRVNNVEVVLEHVLKANGGNHLEIGTLFGGSAIAVALLMEEYVLPGVVVCVDPLNGYYIHKNGHGKDTSGFDVSPDTFLLNLDTFKINHRVALIRSYSDRVDYEDMGIPFSTAFIDGDHDGDAPLEDWNNIKDCVYDYIIFDNYDKQHPDVIKACHMATKDPDWEGSHIGDITFVLECTAGRIL